VTGVICCVEWGLVAACLQKVNPGRPDPAGHESRYGHQPQGRKSAWGLPIPLDPLDLLGDADEMIE
jgi:hypothetical protein